MKRRSIPLLFIPAAALAVTAMAGVPANGSPSIESDATAPAMRMKFFQTPSGNIRCGMFRTSGKWSMRCDIYDHSWVAPPRPTPCDFGDYGSSVGMSRKGSPRFLCVSDAMDGGSTLTYGKSLQYGPFFCRSRPKGLKCFNAGGRGWFLSRQSYDLF